MTCAWPACLLLLAAAVLPSCRSPAASTAPAKRPPVRAPAPDGERAYYEGTAAMQARAAKEIARFESTDVKERLEAAAWLTQLGEPAAPPLLRALAEHPSARTRGMAAYTLGFLGDHRALEPLARALRDGDLEVRAEAATALVRNGDRRGLATLIAGLEDADPRVRSRAIAVLRAAVGETLGFAPDDELLERQAAVARWKGWLERQRAGAG